MVVFVAAEKEGEDAEAACARSALFANSPQNSLLSPSLQPQESAARLVPLIKAQTQEKIGGCLQGRAEGLPEGLFTGK